MRALIADDEAPARDKIRRLLDAAPDVEVVGEARSGREAVAAIRRARPDLVFLDIHMPGADGFDVLGEIGEHERPYVIFTTADDQQAVRAFEAGAVDYLLKPYSPTRFAQVLERARSRLGAATPDTGSTQAAPPLSRLLVVENGRATFVTVDRIDYVEADGNYVMLAVGGERHRLRATIATLAARLDPEKFIQVNRSTIVRLDAIQAMHAWSHGDYRLTMADGCEITWSRRYRAAAAQAFGLKP